MRINIVISLLLLQALLFGCLSNNQSANISVNSIQNITANATNYISFKTVHYQLQNANFSRLLDLHANYLIMDPDDSKLTREQIQALEDDGTIVLAYLSIGEAENYRNYWQSDWRVGNPSFIDLENPSWPGNYKVKYWDPRWQEIILNRTRELSQLGYSGVFLDVVDAYYYYQERGVANASEEMIGFVGKIKNVGTSVTPSFLIVPQNALDLYSSEDYRVLVNGLGAESTWYNGDVAVDQNETSYALSFMDSAVKDGKFVLSIDYPTETKNICDFYSKCHSHGFVCTVSNLNLSLDEPLECEQ